MTKPNKMEKKIFKIGIRVSGNLGSSFCFETMIEALKWIKEEFPKLQEKYGKLEYELFFLPGLAVGDKCNVWGEGDSVFTIKSIIKYSKNRYGFILNSGFAEEVTKCHTEIIDMRNN